jgi:hypothetical protein
MLSSNHLCFHCLEDEGRQVVLPLSELTLLEPPDLPAPETPPHADPADDADPQPGAPEQQQQQPPPPPPSQPPLQVHLQVQGSNEVLRLAFSGAEELAAARSALEQALEQSRPAGSGQGELILVFDAALPLARDAVRQLMGSSSPAARHARLRLLCSDLFAEESEEAKRARRDLQELVSGRTASVLLASEVLAVASDQPPPPLAPDRLLLVTPSPRLGLPALHRLRLARQLLRRALASGRLQLILHAAPLDPDSNPHPDWQDPREAADEWAAAARELEREIEESGVAFRLVRTGFPMQALSALAPEVRLAAHLCLPVTPEARLPWTDMRDVAVLLAELLEDCSDAVRGGARLVLCGARASLAELGHAISRQARRNVMPRTAGTLRRACRCEALLGPELWRLASSLSHAASDITPSSPPPPQGPGPLAVRLRDLDAFLADHSMLFDSSARCLFEPDELRQIGEWFERLGPGGRSAGVLWGSERLVSLDRVRPQLGPLLDAPGVSEALLRALDASASRDMSLSMRALVAGLSALLRGGPEERAEAAFRLWDADRDGRITRADLLEVQAALRRALDRVGLDRFDLEEPLTAAFCELAGVRDANELRLDPAAFREALQARPEAAARLARLGRPITPSAAAVAAGEHAAADRSRATGMPVLPGHPRWMQAWSLILALRRTAAEAEAVERDPWPLPPEEYGENAVAILQLPAHPDGEPRGTLVFDHARLAFRRVRRLYGFDWERYGALLGPERLLGSLLVGRLRCLHEIATSARSGSFFFSDDRGSLVIKTLPPDERERLLRLLPAYLKYFDENPHTLLPRLLQLLTLRPRRGPEVSVVVMASVFGSELRISGIVPAASFSSLSLSLSRPPPLRLTPRSRRAVRPQR